MEKRPRSGEAGRRQRALQAVQRNAFVFARLDPDLRADREIVLEAAKQGWGALQWAGEELQSDKGMLLEVVKYHGLSLQHASRELRADREVVLAAVEQDWLAIQVADKSLLAEKAFVLEVVAQNGCALQFASEALRSDREVVMAAVSQSAEALRFAHKSFQADREVVIQALRQGGCALQFACQDLRDSRDFVLQAVELHGDALAHAAPGLRADRELAIEAVKRDGAAWVFAGKKLRLDKDILLLAARNLREDGRAVLSKAMDQLGISKEAVANPIAVRGEAAPVIVIDTLILAPLLPELAVGPEEAMPSLHFHCEGSLLSGAQFECSVMDCHVADQRGSDERLGPILNDLVATIVEELPRQTQLTDVNRVFVNFSNPSDGAARAVSPWDGNRPLRDFLTS